jgi:hypothetical protein
MEKMSEKKINNQNSFLWKMGFTITFYTFYSVGNNFKKSKKLEKISAKKFNQKPCVNAETVCAVPQQNRV